jgi:GNAT superfamily N-acetyltransferase
MTNGPAAFAVRPARREDLPRLVQLLADDVLGQSREQPLDPLPQSYIDAFEEIDRDPRNLLAVAEDEAGQVMGVLQLTFIPTLSLQGSQRLLIENVRIDSARRGQGIGRQFMQWAIEEGRRRGCRLAELTTNKVRTDAQGFYVELGFTPSHVGMKLPLD